MVNQFNPLEQIESIRARREERNRRTQQLLSQYGGKRGASIARDLANQQQSTLNAPLEPTPSVQAQEEFRQAQEATEQIKLPLGIETTVGAQAGAKEDRGKPEFGSFFGSGVLEGAAGAGLRAAENVQKGIEATMGTAVGTVAAVTPGDLFGFESNLQRVVDEKGDPSFWNVAGQAQNFAEAFRITDMPSFHMDLIPGEGVNLPGDNTLNEFQFGVKGALELLPDALLTVATGGASLAATGTKLGAVKAIPTVAARTVGLDVLASGVKAIPKVVTKTADIKKLAAPVYRNVTNLTLETGRANIERAKIPEMRQMLNRLKSVSGAGGAISGVMHAVSPAMLLENGKNLMTDIVYGRLNALSLVPGAVEANTAVYIEKIGGIGNSPAKVGGDVLGEGRADIGRRVSGSPVGRVAGKVRSKVFGPNEQSPMLYVDSSGLIVADAGSEIENLNGKVWTNAFSDAFKVGEDGELTIRLGDDAVIPEEFARNYIDVDVNGVPMAPVVEGSDTVPQLFGKYVKVDTETVPGEITGSVKLTRTQRLLLRDEVADDLGQFERSTHGLFEPDVEGFSEGKRKFLVDSSLNTTETNMGPIALPSELVEDAVQLVYLRDEALPSIIAKLDEQIEAGKLNPNEFVPGTDKTLRKVQGERRSIEKLRSSLDEMTSAPTTRRVPGSFTETEGTRFYTLARHSIETYQDMAKHYEWATGKMISRTAKMRFTDSAYVPQVPNGGDWFDDVSEALGVGGKPGDKKRPFQERSYFADDLQAAIDEGHYEMAGPLEAMQSYMTNMYTATIDAGMVKHINSATKDLESGVVDFNKVAKSVQGAITRLSKGGNVSDKKGGLIKKLEAVGFDALPQEMKRIQGLEGDARTAAISRLKEVFKKERKDLNGQYYAVDETKGRKAPAFAGIMFRDVGEVEESGKKVRLLGAKEIEKRGGTIIVDAADQAKRVSRAANLGDPSRAQGAVEIAAETGDLLRVGKTGFDFGFHMIHGIPAIGIATGRFLAGHPKEAAKLYGTWAKSVKTTFDAFFRPKVLMETMMREPALVQEAVENGLQLSREAQDFFLATQNATVLRRIPKAGETMDALLTDLANSFQRAFVAPGDLLRIEGYRIMRNTAGQSENGLTELTGFLNKMTGALNSSASGVGRGQQQLERGFLFFSPRYTRSAMALFADVYRGGTRGELARQTMVGMAFFGAATYYAFSKAMGQEAKFDPSESDFMTVQIGDSTVGVGGFWTQFVRLSSKLAETAWDEDAQAAFGDASENPLWRWVRSRAAPGAGAAWDIANGEDYMGRQFTSLGDVASHVGRQALPIWAEASLLEDPYRTGPAGITAEVLGSRTNPLSASKRRRQLRNSIANDAFGKKWEDLNALQRKLITEGKAEGMTADEKVQLDAYTDEVLSGNADRNEEVDVNIEKWHHKREEIDLIFNAQIKQGIDHLQTEGSGVDPQFFREFYLGNASAQRRTRLEDLNDPEGEYALTMNYYTDISEKFGSEHPEDVAYYEYIDTIIATEDFDAPNGFNFRKRDDAILAFRQRWGDEVYAYVQEIFETGRDLEPLVEEFYKGRQRYEYYWRDVEEQTLASMPRAGELRETYQRYLDADANGKREMKDNDRLLRKYLNTMSDVKKELRKKDQMLDAWLFRWGYTDTLSHKNNRVAPDGISNPREYWRAPEVFPLSIFGIGEGVNLPAIEQPSLQAFA